MHPYLRLELLITESSPTERGGRSGRGRSISGPLLRRVLGKALVDRFCPFGRPVCQPRPAAGERPAAPADLCRLAETCPYGVLFAASLTNRPPYALYVEESGPARSDREWRIEVTLFGPAWRLYPWCVQALNDALERGLGRERRRYRLEEVGRGLPGRESEAVSAADLSTLAATLPAELLGLGLEPYLAEQSVIVELLSPARLLSAGRLLPGHEPVPFALLIGRILQRFADLYGSDASEVLRPEIRSAIEAEAATVPLLRDETRWVETADYSARSGAELLLGGKVGRLVYGGTAARFLPILRTGEILHVGKNAASGCGRIRVDLERPDGHS